MRWYRLILRDSLVALVEAATAREARATFPGEVRSIRPWRGQAPVMHDGGMCSGQPMPDEDG